MSAASECVGLGLESSSGTSVSGSSPEFKKFRELQILAFPCPEFSAFQEKFLKSSKEVGAAGSSESIELIDALSKDKPHWFFDARHFIELLILIHKNSVDTTAQVNVVYSYLDKNIDALNNLKEVIEILDKESLEKSGQVLMLALINGLKWLSEEDFQTIEKIFSFIEYLIYKKNISPNFYLNNESPFYNLIYIINNVRYLSIESAHLSIMKKMVSKLIKALIKFEFDFNSTPPGGVVGRSHYKVLPLHFVIEKLRGHPLLINVLTKILACHANPFLISALSKSTLYFAGRGFPFHLPSPLPILFQYGMGLIHKIKRINATGGDMAYARLDDEIYFPFAKPDDSTSFDYVTKTKKFADRLSTTCLELEEIDRLSVVCQNVLQADPKVLAEGVLEAVERNKDAIINCRSNLNSALFECFGIKGLTNITVGYLTSQPSFEPKKKM